MHKLNSAPAFKLAVLFITGILIGANIKFNLLWLIICFCILSVFTIYIVKKNYENEIIIFVLSLLIILSGIIKSNYDFYIIPENSISKVQNTPNKSESQITGIIDDIPNSDSSKTKFILNCKSVKTDDSTKYVTGLVLVIIINDTSKGIIEPDPHLTAGDEVRLFGRLTEPQGERNPGEFDYKRYLALHNIHKIFHVKGIYNVEKLSSGNLSYIYQNILYPAKVFANKNIDEFTGGNEGAFLKGLITGDRGDFTKEMKEYFVNAGVMHLIAVSGLNVAYIILTITLILSLFRIPLIPRTIITIIILILYCLFTGSPASIIRASVMAILVLIAFIIQRKINFYNIIGIAVLIILFYDSKQLFDAGFILSFSAVLSLIFFYNRIDKIFLYKIENWLNDNRKYFYYIIVLFITSFSAQIGTLPITALYFGRISLISLFANIIAVPLSNISLAIGFFQIITATFSNYLSGVIAETNSLLLWGQLGFIKFCGNIDFAYFEFYKFNALNTIFYFLILIFLVTANIKNIRFRVSASIITIIFLYILNINFESKLKITFLNVGQGDCTLIQTPENKNILIDCGPSAYNYDAGEKIVAPYLKRNDISIIDILILTHNHNDHAGGVTYLLKNFEVKNILTNYDDYNLYLENFLKEKNISYDKLHCGDNIKVDDLNIYLLYPVVPEKNGNPLVMKLKYKNTNILLAGDISKDDEERLVEYYGNFLNTNILKVSHHGSKNSSSPEFLITCQPFYSIISCGLNNNFGHPAPVTIDKLRLINSKVLRTDIDGAVIFESDGNSLKLIKE